MLKTVTNPTKFASQQQAYLSLRQKEGRVYSDEQVNKLPYIKYDHSLAAEWKIRKHSSEKLIKYLSAKNKPLQILEIGCGNGWLCHCLSAISNSQIIGLDINLAELEQATRVFSATPNLQFMYGDFFENILAERKFDILVFASSIQYFSDINALLEKALALLNKNGEIHIIDSPIYKLGKEAKKAGERSADYFAQQGFSKMAQYYHHHTYSTFQKFKHRIIKPAWRERVLRKGYFPWVIASGL